MGRSSSPIDNHYHDSSSTTMTRSTSPLHFLNPSAVAHLTHHHHHCSHRASATAAAQADISRLLDPSYLPSSSSRAAHVSPTAVTAYVDPHGDLHDPDYRHFPVSSHHHSNQHSPKRRGTSPRRPHFDWEIDLDEHALDDEYEEEGSFSKHNSHLMAPRYLTTASSSRSSSGQSQSTRPRDSSFSTTLSMPMSKYSPTYYSPTGTASTLPTSYEDDSDELNVESPFEEKEKKGRRLSKGDKEKEKIRAALEKEREEEAQREKEAEKERERVQEQEEKEREEKEARRASLDYIDLTPSPRRISRTYGRTRHRALDLYDEEERRLEYDNDEDDSAHLHPSRNGDGAAEHEYVPTCTQGLKRQWQALSLGFRFSVFRAQKRVMKRVASLTT